MACHWYTIPKGDGKPKGGLLNKGRPADTKTSISKCHELITAHFISKIVHIGQLFPTNENRASEGHKTKKSEVHETNKIHRK